jgi:biotin transport system substrate-specific component
MAQRETMNAQAVPSAVRDVPHRIREGGLILAMVALMAVSAQLAVPIPGTPVPITLQDLAAFAVGLVLGPAQGGVAVASYLLLGAAGAPVFSNGHGGLPWLMGPTGGFLLAFPISAWLCGLAARSGRLWVLAVGILAAQAVMFACGIGQLMLVTGTGLTAGIQQALIPFLPGIAFKSALLFALGAALAAHRRSTSKLD